MPAVAFRGALAGLGVGAALLGVVALVGSGPAGAAPQTQAFSFTGAPQSFVVPANVCQLAVDAFGAQGGAQNSASSADAKSQDVAADAGPQPGLGGEVRV